MKRCLILVFVLMLSLSGTTPAAYIGWDNDSGDQLWETAANWNEGDEEGYGDDVLPVAGQDVAITGGIGIAAEDVHVYINTGVDAICEKLFINRNSVHGTIYGGTPENNYSAVATAPVVVTVNGGTLTTTDNEIRIASRPGDYGVLELISGSISIQDGGEELEIGEYGVGVFNMSGGTMKAKDIRISYEDGLEGVGQGYMNMSGGSIELTDDLEIANNGEVIGALTMSGGTIAVNDSFDIGRRGNGTVFMSGGTISGIKGDLEMATDPTGKASILMTGGEILVGDDMKLGDDGGSANIVMAGGYIYVNDELNITNGNEPGTSGTVVLGGAVSVGDHDNNEDTPEVVVSIDALGIIDTKNINMDNAGAEGVTGWIDFQLGGLLLLRNGDKTDDVQDYIDNGFFFTTYTGDWFGAPAYVGYDFDDTIAGGTAVYLVPEPATIALLGFGLVALRRKKRA